MTGYETQTTIVPSLPDGRLARIVTTPTSLTYEHLEGAVHPDLIRDLDELGRHVARSGLHVLDLSKLGTCPLAEHFITRVPDDMMPTLGTFYLRQGRVSGHPFYEFRIRASMVIPEVARELNEDVFPHILGVVVDAPEAIRRREIPPALSFDLDF